MPCYIPYHASKGDDDDDVVDVVDDDVVDVVKDDGNVSLSQVSWGKRRKRRRRREKGDGVGASLNCVALSNQILYYKYKYKCIIKECLRTDIQCCMCWYVEITFIWNLFEVIAMQTIMVSVML